MNKQSKDKSIKTNRKNNLNVFKYGYLYWRYLPNWPHNIVQFFRNIKYVFQRATRGYCDQDIWNLDYYYTQLIAASLDQLADITIAYPGRGEFADTDENGNKNDGYGKWKDYLREIAQHLRNTDESDDTIPINQEISKAYDIMDRYLDRMEFEPTDDGMSKLVKYYKNEDLYNEAQEIWLQKEREAMKYREQEKNIALDMLKDNWFDFWD